MKKVLLVALAAFGTLALSGCDMINSLISGEKQYKYNDFKAEIADRKLSFDATKCKSTLEVDGKKTEREYTYQTYEILGVQTWVYKYYDEDLKTDLTGSKDLDLVNYFESIEMGAAFVKKDVDEIYKFYAKSDSYRIVCSYSDDEIKYEAEYKFGKDGLMTYSYEKNTDLKKVTSKEEKETFTYSK